MEEVLVKTVCSNCKHGICKHRRYYTYDNRMMDFYEWCCTKEGKRIDVSKKINTCKEWKEAANS